MSDETTHSELNYLRRNNVLSYHNEENHTKENLVLRTNLINEEFQTNTKLDLFLKNHRKFCVEFLPLLPNKQHFVHFLLLRNGN